MKKIYLLICAVLLAQGAMAIDYEQLKKNSKINAMSKIELAKLQTQEEKAVAQSKATGSKLKALQKQMDNRTLRAIVKMTPGTDAAILADDGITVTSVVNHFAIVSMPLAQLEQLAEQLCQAKKAYAPQQGACFDRSRQDTLGHRADAALHGQRRSHWRARWWFRPQSHYVPRCSG